MPKFTTAQEVIAAIEDCVLEQGGKMILRFGHGQIRQLGADDAELLVNAFKSRGAPEAGVARWVPVAASIALTRVNEVTIGLPIFGHDQEGQWYRLDCEPGLPHSPQQESPK